MNTEHDEAEAREQEVDAEIEHALARDEFVVADALLLSASVDIIAAAILYGLFSSGYRFATLLALVAVLVRTGWRWHRLRAARARRSAAGRARRRARAQRTCAATNTN